MMVDILQRMHNKSMTAAGQPKCLVFNCLGAMYRKFYLGEVPNTSKWRKYLLNDGRHITKNT